MTDIRMDLIEAIEYTLRDINAQYTVDDDGELEFIFDHVFYCTAFMDEDDLSELNQEIVEKSYF